MITLNFRNKIFFAMILLVIGVTVTTLLITENQVRLSYERHFRQSFQVQMASFLQERASRLAPVKQRVADAAASPRLIAAMENAGQASFEPQDVDDLYQNGIDQVLEVMKPSVSGQTNIQLGFFFFQNAKGEVLLPGPRVRLPFSLPSFQQLTQRLATIALSLTREGIQQVGYLGSKDKSSRMPIREMVFTPIVDHASNQKLGVLAVGFPLSATDKEGRGGDVARLKSTERFQLNKADGGAGVPYTLLSGIWLDGQLYSASIPDESISQVEEAISADIAPSRPAGTDLVVRVQGVPYQIYYEALDTGRAFPVAYQACLFSLVEADAEKRHFRQKILALGVIALLGALAMSLFVSRGLVVPLSELVKGTTEIERGNYGFKVPVRSRDEVGILAQAFNDMTQRIEASYIAQEQRIAERNQELVERTRAQEALSQSEASLREAQRIAHLGNWTWNVVSRQLKWSDEVYSMFGEEQQTFQPSYEAFLERVHPDDREKVALAVRQSLETGKPYSLDHRILRPDGGIRIVMERAIVNRDASGNPIAMVGTVQDITEQKRIEAEFLRAQRMDSMGALASGLAHDLNKALSPILMGIQLISRKTKDPESREMLKVMETSTYRGADMVRQVLTFAGGRDDERELLNVGRLIREMESIVRQALPNSIKTSAMVPSDLWPVTGNSTQLHQVLLNLCINARDAMQEGGEITLVADNVDLGFQEAKDIPEATPGQYVMLLVSDNGVGIAPEILPRIFEPFFTTKGPNKGSGLGLSTIARIVRNHGGFVSVKSELGIGTTFEIYLPRALAAVGAAAAPDSSNLPGPGHGELILIIDADQSVREIVAPSLTEHGYRILSAANGAEGLTLFNEHVHEVRLVLTDHAAPRPGGMSISATIRARRPNLPIVLMGSEAQSNESAGVSQFLRKPFRLEQLLNSVARALEPTTGPPSLS